jgi:hypothetical protein
MSNGCARGWGRWLVAGAFAVGLAGALAGRSAAQTDDLLNRTRQLDAVAAQKLEGEVRTALTTASRFAAAQPDVAAERLRKVLAALEADSALAPDRRAELTRQVKAQLKSLEARAAAVRPAEPPRAVRVSPAEQDSVRQRVADIAALQRAGRVTEAERQAELLARQYPDHPAAQALARNASMAARLADANSVMNDQDRRLAASSREIDRTAMPPGSDYELPKDWKQKSERRMKATRLTEEEQKLLKALNQPVQPQLGDTTFEKAADYLATLAGRSLVIEKAALEEGGIQVDSNTPVKLSFRSPVALRTALRSFLSPFGLTYVIKDEVIYVTTTRRARAMLETRVYYLGDIVAGVGPFGNAVNWGPYLSRLQMQENAKQIIQIIKTSIDPESWSDSPGGIGVGSIAFDEITMSLVVRQSTEVHLMLKNSMGGR